MSICRAWLVLVFVSFLQACGGGGDESPPIAAPTAVIRADAALQARQTLQLDARQSADPQGRALTYAWEVTTKPANSDVTVRDGNAAQASLTTTTPGSYVVTLRVSNGAATGTATQAVTVTPDFSGIVDTAQLRAEVDATASRVTLRWKDVAPKGSSYRIESRNADGSFTLVDTVAGLEGLGVDLSWQRPYVGAVTYRVRASYQGALQNLRAGDSAFALDLTGLPTQITLNQPEPVAGGVVGTITDRPSTPYLYVYWVLDGVVLNPRGFGPFDLSYGFGALSNGAHTIQARLMLSAEVSVLLTRTVQSSSVGVAISGSRDGNNVVGFASSDSGIVNVRAQIDGVDIGTLQAPNYNNPDRFVFPFDPRQYVSGNHTARVSATNGAGTTRSAEFTLEIRNAPVVALTGVRDGQIVSGSVTFSGTVTSDGPRPITTRVTVQPYPALGPATTLVATTELSFSTPYDFGNTPGTYLFEVVSTDNYGSWSRTLAVVTFTRASTGTAPLGWAVGGDGVLLAADDSNAVIRRNLGGAYLWRANGTEAPLGGNGLVMEYLDLPLLQGGRAVSFGNTEGVGQQSYTHVLQWGADGVPRELSAASPFANPKLVDGVATVIGGLAASGSLVAWYEYQPRNAGTHLVVYDSDTREYRRVAVATGFEPRLLSPYRAGNVVRLAYVLNSTTAPGTQEVRDWSADSGTSALRSNALGITWLKADAERIVWYGAGIGLISQASGAGTAVTLSTTTNAPDQPSLADGMLAWIDAAGGTRSVRASTAAGPIATVAPVPRSFQIPESCNARLMGTAGGNVVYNIDGGLYRWSVAAGSTRLIDAMPCDVKLTPSAAYFTLGASKQVYRSSLLP